MPYKGMKKGLKRTGRAVALALWWGASSAANAGSAFFAPDGKTVTLAPSNGLGSVDVETCAFKPLALPSKLQKEEIGSIARGADGEVLFVAQDAIWVLKGQEPARQICKTSPLQDVRDLVAVTDAQSPIKDWLMISAVGKPQDPKAPESRPLLYGRAPGDKGFGEIFCRRTPTVTSASFGPDGRFFFVCDGDVWEGSVSTGDDGWKGVLNGARIAPLATLSTNIANAGAMWVREVAVAGKWIYAVLSGHHMGAIVRTPLPTPQTTEDPSIIDQYRTMAETLAKAEVITEDFEHFPNFCVCEVNGKPRLFFTNRQDLMLWEGKEVKAIGKLPEP